MPKKKRDSVSIKSPTRRKVLNRKWTPIRYRTEARGVAYGWVYKQTDKIKSCYFIGLGRKRLPKAEWRYITEI